MRILALVSDAFGCQGGIALYNRDLLRALCSYPGVAEVVAVTRRAPGPLGPLPPRLKYDTGGCRGILSFFWTVLRHLVSGGKYDLICCGHLRLLPFAYLASRWAGAPLILWIFGIDAWQPPGSPLAARLAGKVDAVISISEVTRERFLGWARIDAEKMFILPNAIDPAHYGPGPKNPKLLRRYGLAGRTVLLTLGRLVASERYKGIDEILESLPALAERIPGLAYLIAGDGDDRGRLAEKAKSLGVADRVVFAGFVPEAEKADLYRLADAYVMPGRGEGFGFVFLEAMACGIPVLGSKLDGSREALRQGELGILVDPGDRDELQWGILEVLNRPRGVVPPGLEYFSVANFTRRCHDLIGRVWEER